METAKTQFGSVVMGLADANLLAVCCYGCSISDFNHGYQKRHRTRYENINAGIIYSDNYL